MTVVRINQNSHTAAMCETQHPSLCDRHLAEVRNDGDLLEVLATNHEVVCDMCKIDEEIKGNTEVQYKAHLNVHGVVKARTLQQAEFEANELKQKLAKAIADAGLTRTLFWVGVEKVEEVK